MLSMDTKRKLVLAIVILGALLYAAGRVAILYADYLWFDTLGYAAVFTTELWTKVILGAAVFVVTGAWLAGNALVAARLAPGRYVQIKGLPWVIPSQGFKRMVRIAGTLIILTAAFVFARNAADNWYAVLQFLNRPSFEWADPVLGYDASFYVFIMPVLEILKDYVMAMAVFGAAAAAAAYLIGGALAWPGEPITRPAAVHLAIAGCALAVMIGFGYWLDRFDLLYGSRGAVAGAGYTDVHVRMPAMAGMAVVSLIAGALLLAAGIKRRAKTAYAAVVLLVGLHVSAIWSYPSIIQRFQVEPNELVLEMPYIENNIKATRFAYDISDVEVRPYSATGTLSLKDIHDVRGTIENVRIWDWRVLIQTYNQIEALRPYYHFNDVDVDRYPVDGRYRQVTLAVRELDTQLLNEESRTWVNLHLLYTHGYGLCMSPVNAVTPEGLPDLWIRNIPPQSRVDIPITRPAVYFGELTRNYVFVRTTQKEFDYPLGAENRYAEYAGLAGVPIDSAWRRLMFAYYFGDWNILLTNSFTPETRVIWARQVLERAHRLAPFFEFDDDPYPVVFQGRIVWIIDAYARTARFPYSARGGMYGRGPNYIRNPVKAVIDAYDGNVTFYVIDPQEPITLAARAVFPSLFRDLSEMPAELRAHLRYPTGFFETQAEQYLAYHMTDPRIFYNKEDLWFRPNHVFEGQTKPIEAYYFIMSLPGQKNPEYLLMLPFTPAKKDNMVGWMAGRCDGADYGKLLCYVFPKDHLVFGPNQIEARINQNDEISPFLTLWNQHGSRVVRGNLLVIPIGDSILYVEPLYLKSENAAIPELKRVIISYLDRIAMRPTLDDALAAVFGGGTPAQAPPTQTGVPQPTPPTPAPSPAMTLRARALELYEKAERLQRTGDWAGYGATMKELGDVLRDLAAEGKTSPRKNP